MLISLYLSFYLLGGACKKIVPIVTGLQFFFIKNVLQGKDAFPVYSSYSNADIFPGVLHYSNRYTV